jgi:DnaJ-class molecular chaperone
MTDCPTCDGDGVVEVGPPRDPARFAHMAPCPDCGGRGVVEAQEGEEDE